MDNASCVLNEGEGPVELAQIENADGTTWRVTGAPGLRDEDFIETAQQWASAAKVAYDRMIGSNLGCAPKESAPGNWGLEVRDSDCVLEIELQDFEPLTASAGGDGNDVLVRVGVDLLRARPGLAWWIAPSISDAEVAADIMSHELFHHVQYTQAGKNSMPRSVSEGQARFVETLFAPELQDRPDSSWYSTVYALDPIHEARSGVNSWALQPDLGLCQRKYDTAILWGFLYQEFGGMEALQLAWDQFTYRTPCEEKFFAAVDHVVDVKSNGQETGGSALLRMGVYAELDLLEWTAPEQGQKFDGTKHLLPIERQSLVTDHLEGSFQRPRDPGNLLEFDLDRLTDLQTATHAGSYWAGAGGIQYVDLPRGVPLQITVDSDDAWHHAIITRDGHGAATTQPLDAGEAGQYEAPLDGDAVLVSARGAETEGWFQVQVTPDN